MLVKTYNIDEIREYDYKYSRLIKYLLEKNEWKKVDGVATYSDKNSKSVIKTYLDGTEEIFLKHRLAKRFGKYCFIPESIVLEKNNDVDKVPVVANDSDTWFLKPSSMRIGSGEGITILKIDKGDKFREKVKKHMSINTPYVLQRTLKNLMLVNNVKFDVRVIGVIVYTPTEFASYIMKYGQVRYAVKEFNKDSDDKEVMITNTAMHRKKTKEDLRKIIHPLTEAFDENHPAYNIIMINNIFGCVTKCIMDTIIKKRNKKDYGFIVVGLDVMMADDSIFIIEINQHPFLYDDSSSVEAALNMTVSLNFVNKIFIKDFYEIVFAPIINNKLKQTDHADWLLSYYTKFDKHDKCRPGIVFSTDSEYLYKFSLTNKDVDRLTYFMVKQPSGNIKMWIGKSNFTRQDSISAINMNYGTKKLIFGYAVEERNRKHIVGAVGINYRTDKYAKQYVNNYFTSVIVDKDRTGKGVGYNAMTLLIAYIKKTVNPSKIYATVYKDNTASIKLHKKLGYREIGIHDSYKGKDIMIYELDLKK